MRCSIGHALVLVFAAVAAAHGRPALTARGSSDEAAIAHLHTAVTTQRDGSHLPLLFSLRQLRDATLRSFFEQLVDHDDWQVQVHAVLGLAELGSTGQVILDSIGRVDAGAQEAIIASAIDLQLLDANQLASLLRQQGLGDLPQLMLHAEAALHGGEIDVPHVQQLAENSDLRVAALASLLLAQRGDQSFFTSVTSRYRQAPPRVQRVVLPWILDAIRQYRLTSAGHWLRELLQDPAVSERDRQFIVLAAFDIDPDGSFELWRAWLGPSPSYVQRVRAGFMLLAAGERTPPEAYDELLRNSNDDELLIRLAAAGQAVARGDDVAQDMINLIDLGNTRTTEWVMSTLDQDQSIAAQRVYRHIIEQVDREDIAHHGGHAERVGLAVNAAARLFSLDEHWVIGKLHHADTSTTLKQAILLGMFESDSPAAGEAAAELKVVGVGRDASLRTLLIAKHAASLTDEQLRQLGMIAGGGGRVSEVLRAQAAWLYLKHAGQIDVAMSRLFTP